MSLKSKGLREFGPYRFDMAERTLWREGKTVSVTLKALDTLAVLLGTPGGLVEKADLIRAVWPDTFVEEGNLTVQISLLRKTFGEENYIETVPRRGYRFVAAVREVAGESEPALTSEKPSLEVGIGAVDSTPALPRRWVLGAAATIGAGGAFLLWRDRRRETSGRLLVASVAVLPFQMLQATADDAPLGLGLADAVIARLGSLNRFIVRPTSAVRQFDQAGRNPLRAGEILGVEAVLDATIQVAGDRIRLNVQMVRVRDGKHLWTDTFDLHRADLFTLEDELSSRLVRSLFGQEVAGGRYRPKPEAFRLYTLGQFYRNRWTLAGARKAVEYAEQAIALDAADAPAHALLAEAWTLLGYLFGVSPREAYPKAEAAALKALSLDESSSQAHQAVGAVRLFYDWNFPEAERHLRRSLELNPNNPDTVQLFGVLRAIQHRNAEGVAALRRAIEIDPASAWRHVGMTFQYACANQIDAAVGAAQRAHELDPLLGAPLFDLYNLHMTRGDHRGAVDAYVKQNTRPGGNQELAAALRDTFEKAGIRGFLEARIARYLAPAQRGKVPPLILAQQYAFLGRRDEAMRWVEKALEERQATILFLNQHPMYASLRGHPIFKEIVRKIGL